MSLNQLYDEALETDAQLQSARSGLTVGSEQLPQARAKLLPQLSASVTASEQRTELGGGFLASSGNSNGYTVSLTPPHQRRELARLSTRPDRPDIRSGAVRGGPVRT